MYSYLVSLCKQPIASTVYLQYMYLYIYSISIIIGGVVYKTHYQHIAGSAEVVYSDMDVTCFNISALDSYGSRCYSNTVEVSLRDYNSIYILPLCLVVR